MMNEKVKFGVLFLIILGFLFFMSWGQSIPIVVYTATGQITDKTVDSYRFYFFINNSTIYQTTSNIYAQFHVGDTITFTAGHPLLNPYEVITEASK